MAQQYIKWFKDLGLKDLEQVGGKNASLGEMISQLKAQNVRVPDGFATTQDAYWAFLAANDLEQKIHAELDKINMDDVSSLMAAGKKVRAMINQQEIPAELEQQISDAYQQLLSANSDMSVAVRSSATLEDLPDASFAGQQETFLNVQGIDQVLQKVREVFASLFTDRAISYRAHHGFEHKRVALSAGIQQMVRSDKACSGVMFSIDTESGFDQVVFITGSYGLGELLVQGSVNPDEYYVFKPALAAGNHAVLRKNIGGKHERMIFSDQPDKLVEVLATSEQEQQQFVLTDAEVTELAEIAVTIEQHYGRPMDIEWAKDGIDGQLYIVQARPETVQSKTDGKAIEKYQLKQSGKEIITGRSIGQKIGAGKARVVKNLDDITTINEGEVLVTDMTDPDWEPVMKKAAAIVTNRGGRTCHAAIIARELGIPAVVGTGEGTKTITNGAPVTVSCAEGDTGFIYEGELDFEVKQINLSKMPDLAFKIMMNVGNPDRAFAFQALPNYGVGLARLEFIINRMIGIHPEACLNFASLKPELQQQIQTKIAGYADPVDYYVKRLAEGIASIAAAFHQQPVIVRLSDFKSNEYANLIGGDVYEPDEENPMLGFRGASRYVADKFKPCFELECRAVKFVREQMGLSNVQVMIPFVRTVAEAKQVIQVLEEFGLKQGENDLKVIMMCELPSNALLADEFLDIFDGFSIGSNDLTQLTLGLDRDSAIIADLFDERDAAVKKLLAMAIKACKDRGKYVGICGQGPSDHPDLAQWLMEQGIESVSLNPDTVLETWLYLAEQH